MNDILRLQWEARPAIPVSRWFLLRATCSSPHHTLADACNDKRALLRDKHTDDLRLATYPHGPLPPLLGAAAPPRPRTAFVPPGFVRQHAAGARLHMAVLRSGTQHFISPNCSPYRSMDGRQLHAKTLAATPYYATCFQYMLVAGRWTYFLPQNVAADAGVVCTPGPNAFFLPLAQHATEGSATRACQRLHSPLSALRLPLHQRVLHNKTPLLHYNSRAPLFNM